MALITLNGLGVPEARIYLPREGRWWADLVVDADSADTLWGAASLDLGGALTLKGTVQRCGAWAGTVTAQVVGGAGGLHRPISPKAYQGVPLRLPLRDALAEVGETLSSSSDPAVLNTLLAKWVRMRGEAAAEVENLLGEAPAGTGCRVLPDGTVWVGQETWPEASFNYTLLEDRRWCGEVTLGVEVPSLQPGTTLMGRKVDHVEHRVGSSSVRTVVQFLEEATDGGEAKSGTDGDRLLQVLDRRLAPARFQRLFPARVVKQNDDLSLELVLDDDIAPGLSNVPMRTFAPSVQLKVSPGSRCAVQFEGGEPQRPVATLFEMGSVLELALTAAKVTLKADQVLLGDGAKPVALEGSATLGHTHTYVLSAPPGGGVVTGSINPATDSIAPGPLSANADETGRR